MADQLTAADLNDLQDEVIDLYTGTREIRELVLDPLVVMDDGLLWTDDTDGLRAYLRAAGTASQFAQGLPMCVGDKLHDIEVNLYQESGTAITLTVYSVDQDGVRTSRGSVSTPGGTGAAAWHTLSTTVDYELPAGETFVLHCSAAVAGDKYGGGIAQVSTPP